MRKTVETTGGTYEEAVERALAELGLEREAVDIAVLRTRDPDASASKQFRVRVWQRDAEAISSQGDDPLDVVIHHPTVCEHSGPTEEEAIDACLRDLHINREQADVEVLKRSEDGQRVRVRVWRKRLTEPAPRHGEPGHHSIHDVHAAAALPGDDDIFFEDPNT
jgi:predicted RNA-binding protein Jag